MAPKRQIGIGFPDGCEFVMGGASGEGGFAVTLKEGSVITCPHGTKFVVGKGGMADSTLAPAPRKDPAPVVIERGPDKTTPPPRRQRASTPPKPTRPDPGN